jgi:hypothetical protein
MKATEKEFKIYAGEHPKVLLLNCTALANMIISEKSIDIAYNAFANCPKLSEDIKQRQMKFK